MSFVQRLLKLRRMTAGEVRFRISHRIEQLNERATWHRRSTPVVYPSAANSDLLQNAALLVPGASRTELDTYLQQVPDSANSYIESSIQRASRIRQEGWAMLGHTFRVDEVVEWHRDPRTQYRWPRTFYADLSLYSLPSGVDVKYVWELGRHQYLAELARGWRMTGDNSYAVLVRHIILDWIQANPLYEGIHWTSGLEVAMRSISWIWSLALLSDWEDWGQEELCAIGQSLCDHAAYLDRHFSIYSSPFNHLIGEGCALFLLSVLLANVPEALEWRGRSRAILETYGPGQFYEDGFCVEQATGYHFYTLAFLSLAILAARARNEPIKSIEEPARRAFLAGAEFRQPDGRWPAIGDLDSARAIPRFYDDFWKFDSLCSLGAVLFDEPKLKVSSEEPGEEIFELLGVNGIRQWERISSAPPSQSSILPSSGYFIARFEKDWLLFDAGPVAGGLHSDSTPSAAHGHADTLQLLYFQDSKPLLVDAGMPFYGGPSEWVNHFRSASAHNTIVVQGAAPVRPAGRLAWSHAATKPVLDVKETPSPYAVASGEAAWGPVHVRRHILGLFGFGVYIADQIIPDQDRLIEWHWHLPKPESALVPLPWDNAWQIGDSIIAVWTSRSCGVAPTWRIGDAESPVAWEAPAYGQATPLARFSLHLQTEVPITVVTFIGHHHVPAIFTSADMRIECIGNGTSPADGEHISHRNVSWHIPERTVAASFT